jgi:hypothetical protein
LNSFDKFLFFLIPAPIYWNFDLVNFGLLLQDPYDSFESLGVGRMPLPLGFTALCILLIRDIFRVPQRKIFLIRFRADLFILMAMIISLILTALNGGSLIKYIQLNIFIGLSLVLFRLRDYGAAIEIQKIVIFSIIFFIILHLGTYFVRSDLEMPYRYGALLNFSLYSSLVSWPSILTLYLTLMIFEIKINSRMSSIIYSLGAALILFELALADRRESILTLIFISTLALFWVSARSLLSPRISTSQVYLLVFSTTVIAAFMVGLIGARLNLGGYGNGLIDLERIEIWRSAFEPLSGFSIIFGTLNPTNMFHNYFISFIYSFGLFGLLLVIYAFFKLTWFYFASFVKSFVGASSWSLRSISQAVILFILILSNSVNTSITQPYFIVNFFIVLLIINSNLKVFPIKEDGDKKVKKIYLGKTRS